MKTDTSSRSSSTSTEARSYRVALQTEPELRLDDSELLGVGEEDCTLTPMRDEESGRFLATQVNHRLGGDLVVVLDWAAELDALWRDPARD